MHINEYLNFVNETIENLKGFTMHSKEWYEEAIEKITKRADNPYLNVALIGDFSSGKSTFINALIKQNILKTAWLATTAVPTHMYYHASSCVTVVLETVDNKRYDFDDQKQRKKFEKRIGQKLPEDRKDLIAFLTTSNNFAEQIKEIRIHTPADEKFKKICIIDTPGVNPGAKGTELHVMTTRNVLREYADATIILFKADQVYTNSFSKFIEENAKHFLDDAVFVVTMLDVISDDEQDEIVEYVRTQLTQRFGLEAPIVYGCSAKYANYSGEDEKARRWSDSFDRLRDEAIRYIEDRRTSIIQKQLVSLLNQLFVELDKEIACNIDIIQEQLDILKNNSTDRLETELKLSYEKYKSRVDQQFSGIMASTEYELMFQNVKTRAERGINSCTQLSGGGRQTITGYMKDVFPTIVKEEQEKLSKYINDGLEPVNKSREEYFQENEALFNKYNLALNRREKMHPGTSDAVNYDKKYEVGTITGMGGVQETLELAGIVLLIPVAIPLAILDGILGTDLTGFLDNALNGVINFIGGFGLLQRNKERAISEMRTKLESVKRNNKEEFLNQINSSKTDIITSMNDMNEKFLAQYQKIYKAKSSEFEAEQKELNEEMEWYKEVQREIQAYLEEISGRPSRKTADDSIKILVMGDFKSGKSSLVNVLLGEKLLPEDNLPATALITEVHYGKRKKAVVYPKPGKWKGGDNPFEIEATPAEIMRYSAFNVGKDSILNQDASANSCFEKMVIYWPFEKLKPGITMIDTPGVICNSEDSILEDILRADIILFCVSAIVPYTAQDRNILSRLNDIGFQHLIIVNTHVDAVKNNMDKEEFNNFQRQINVVFSDYVSEEHIYSVDSVLGRRAKKNNNRKDLIKSGYYDLEKFLEEYIKMLHKEKNDLRNKLVSLFKH